ncbi:hypothetical protein ACN20G_36660 (plasmid) [Streptomyces sp. BI20]|uniref:hypothetical protein n=1 Tax=Streptomyces sp. BI20 TaxID=3403460 RepID=UPI003C7574D4
MATVKAMISVGEDAPPVRVLAADEPVPDGAVPVLITDTTVYGMTRVAETLLEWKAPAPPWLVLVADAPTRPAQHARYLIRALAERLIGVAKVPYLPVLRVVRSPREALEYKDVQRAAENLRRELLERKNRPMALERLAVPAQLLADSVLAKKEGDLIPPASPTKIPEMESVVKNIFGWGLWLLVLAGAGGVAFGVYKPAVSDKSRGGGGSEPFKWMGGGLFAILISSPLIAILNAVAS